MGGRRRASVHRRARHSLSLCGGRLWPTAAALTRVASALVVVADGDWGALQALPRHLSGHPRDGLVRGSGRRVRMGRPLRRSGRPPRCTWTRSCSAGGPRLGVAYRIPNGDQAPGAPRVARGHGRHPPVAGQAHDRGYVASALAHMDHRSPRRRRRHTARPRRAGAARVAAPRHLHRGRGRGLHGGIAPPVIGRGDPALRSEHPEIRDAAGAPRVPTLAKPGPNSAPQRRRGPADARAPPRI